MSTMHKQGTPHDRQPDEWQKDLNPEPTAGQNHGPATNEPGRFSRTAYDIKELHDRMDNYSSEDMKQIPVLQPGTRLEQGATYIDLNDPEHKEFKAMGNMEAAADNLYVPKSEVGYQIWNRLIGVENPERTGG